MRRHYIALLACAVLTSPAHAYDRFGCITSGSSWTVPLDWSTTNLIETISAGGGAAQSSTTGPIVGNAAGGGLDAALTNTTVLTPGVTVAIGIGTGGAAGINGLDQGHGVNAGVSGGDTWVCKISSCSGYLDSNALVGGHGGLWGATSYDPVNGASCGDAKFGGVGGWCNNGGNTAAVFERASAGGGGAAGGGAGGLGPDNNLSGSNGGGGAGGSCRGGGCTGGNGGAASGATGGAGGPAGTGGVAGAAGGTAGGSITYGTHGANGVAPSGFPPECYGPAPGGSAPAANNATTDPGSATGNPDGGYPGGGGASGNALGSGQGPGKGGPGIVLFEYVSTGIFVPYSQATFF